MKTYLFILLLLIPLSNAMSEDELISNSIEIISDIKQDYTISGSIDLITLRIDEGSAEARRYPSGNIIALDAEDLSTINNIQLKGLLAHELAHLESYSEMNYLQLLIFGMRYSISSNFQKEVEREADIKAIEKGFGEELLVYRIYRLESASDADKKMIMKNYLSPKEIEDKIR